MNIPERARGLALALALAGLCLVPTASAQSGLSKRVAAGGGGGLSGASYGLRATVGQPVVGVAAGSNYKNRYGYWYGGYATATAAKQTVPGVYRLDQNIPNPFNPTTTIRYAVPRPARVTLRVFDVGGREVATLVDGEQAAGVHEVRWNAAGLASGVYFYRLRSDGFTKTKKLVLLK